MAVVTDIVIKDLRPVLTPAYKKYESLLPTVNHPVMFSCTLSNVNNAISNALRRVIGGELLVKGFDCEFSDITTTDVFIIPEMIIQRLRCIPVHQDVPDDTVFEIHVTNKSLDLIDVKSSSIQVVRDKNNNLDKNKHGKRAYHNETFTLFTLNAGCSLTIKNIRITKNAGYVKGWGSYVLGVHTSSFALDQQPIDLFDPNSKGLSSSVAAPRKWKLQFTTNGTIDPHKLMVMEYLQNMLQIPMYLLVMLVQPLNLLVLL
jgi:hypothetical protein